MSTCSGTSTFPTGCKWISASPRNFMHYRGTVCFTVFLTVACRGILALMLGLHPPPLPSFPFTLVSPHFFLSCVLISSSSPIRRTAACRYRCQQVPPVQRFLQHPAVLRNWSRLGSMPGCRSPKTRLCQTNTHSSFFFPDSEIMWVSFGVFPLELPKWQLNTTDYCNHFDTAGDTCDVLEQNFCLLQKAC